MKKRILSAVMALCLCLSLMPVAANEGDGEPGESTNTGQHAAHCVCGAMHTEVGDHVDEIEISEWTGVSDGAALAAIKKTGNYYLENNVTLSSVWTIANDCNITLCLNGMTLTADNKEVGDTILVEGTLTITDCKDTGKITGTNPKDSSDSNNHKVLVVSTRYTDCTLNLYGGTITGVHSGKNFDGGGVRNEGTFNMYGGTITGNSARSGGGVDNCKNTGNTSYVGPAAFNFYGGTISGNGATNSDDNEVYNRTGSTINANSGIIAGKVYNNGTITTAENYLGTTFSDAVTNKGTVAGGTFSSTVTNNSDGMIKGGTFSGAVTNNRYGTVEGGTFSGTVTNKGIVTGGTFEGAVTNEATIKGGTFESTVTNNGVIELANDAAYQAIKNKLTGTGYVKVGTGDNIKYYLSDGAELNGYYTGEPNWTDIKNGNYPGCDWDADDNTLKLRNVWIETLDLDIGFTDDITIVIDGNVRINKLELPETNEKCYTGTVTILGENGRDSDVLNGDGNIDVASGGLQLKNLKAELNEFFGYDSVHPVQLTNSDVTFNSDFEMFYQDEPTDTVYGLELVDSTVTVRDAADYGDNCLLAECISMDEQSTLTLEDTYFLAQGYAENFTAGLKDFLPNGYSVSNEYTYGEDPVYTIKDDTAEEPAMNLTLQRYYTVDFDLAGGTLNDADTLAAQRVVRGGKVTAPEEDPVKAGYKFDGWYEKNGNTFHFDTPVTKDITLCAKYIDRNTVADQGFQSGGTAVKRPGGSVTVAASDGEVIDYSKSFDDVNESDYFSDALRWACARSITGGATTNTFEPYESCTRAQIVTFLWRAAGMPNAVRPSGMQDVDADAYYKEAVAWAVEKGIASGYGDGLFGPDDTVTREQTTAFLYRYAQAMSMDTTLGGMAVREYHDYENISAYALGAMQWAVNADIVQGDQNYLSPQENCTRAQIVTMLYRLMGK